MGLVDNVINSHSAEVAETIIEIDRYLKEESTDAVTFTLLTKIKELLSKDNKYLNDVFGMWNVSLDELSELKKGKR